jgi:hypothetical protein
MKTTVSIYRAFTPSGLIFPRVRIDWGLLLGGVEREWSL